MPKMFLFSQESPEGKASLALEPLLRYSLDPNGPIALGELSPGEDLANSLESLPEDNPLVVWYRQHPDYLPPGHPLRANYPPPPLLGGASILKD